MNTLCDMAQPIARDSVPWTQFEHPPLVLCPVLLKLLLKGLSWSPYLESPPELPNQTTRTVNFARNLPIW